MKITQENKIHYFIKDESNETWTSFNLESYMVIPQNNGKIKLKVIEQLRLFFATDIENYECGTFSIAFGRNDCHFSGFDNLTEFYKYMHSNRSICDFQSATKEDYLELREKAFRIFLEHRSADFSKLEIGSEFSV
ncbi:hypothetical protein D0817_24690 [Flavobacterium cupreum]|uniref:Uncharacterized protein n=1 Tax=Flavobacterium cupreum TaxID=2133766 RepID=A0A434A063_9FLAO|nr:hypothetical protein [Flavobacterium cupreum]RUT67764.1 hypothetical protein D0817_24690 [Flavobacterium cupreum]